MLATNRLTYAITKTLTDAWQVVIHLDGKPCGWLLAKHLHFAVPQSDSGLSRRLSPEIGRLKAHWYSLRQFANGDIEAVLRIARDELIDLRLIAG